MEEKRIGIYVCWCGTNIAKMVDVEGVAEQIGKLPYVVVSKNYNSANVFCICSKSYE